MGVILNRCRRGSLHRGRRLDLRLDSGRLGCFRHGAGHLHHRGVGHGLQLPEDLPLAGTGVLHHGFLDGSLFLGGGLRFLLCSLGREDGDVLQGGGHGLVHHHGALGGDGLGRHCGFLHSGHFGEPKGLGNGILFKDGAGCLCGAGGQSCLPGGLVAETLPLGGPGFPLGQADLLLLFGELAGLLAGLLLEEEGLFLLGRGLLHRLLGCGFSGCVLLLGALPDGMLGRGFPAGPLLLVGRLFGALFLLFVSAA